MYAQASPLCLHFPRVYLLALRARLPQQCHAREFRVPLRTQWREERAYHLPNGYEIASPRRLSRNEDSQRRHYDQTLQHSAGLTLSLRLIF
jgi:hypothetical protein